MSLQSITNINVDFYDKKYIMLNAKQYDDCSRWIYITCYNDGSLYNLSNNKHTAYIRYKKADGRKVLNSCRINSKSEVMVELTEQMLSASGVCYVDLMIVNKGSAIVNVDTGRITTNDGSAIMSTMAFCIDVQEAAVDNSAIESSDEYNGLVDLLERAETEYGEVVQLARSYAIGDADNIRENEDYDNSKYYSRMSKSWAVGDTGVRTGENTNNSKYYSEQSSASASASETAQGLSEAAQAAAETAQNKAETAQNLSETAQKASEAAQGKSEEAQSKSEVAQAAAETAQAAAEAAQAAAEAAQALSETAKALSEAAQGKAETAQSNAEIAEQNADNSAIISESWAVGGTGKRDGEDTNNAKYYYEAAKDIADSIRCGFIPKGTIAFSELSTAEKDVGYVYNISDDFITDESFREGSGHSYTAGTNVYYTVDGYWDCFGGHIVPMATVDEVKTFLSI